ncbi:MAG: VWA domain-containing protein [Candidatus Omnitrophica bacterium]|nr:VWA domain-containing protein [Candidatus Omnitrophota bacterium]MBU0880680.1 VWA domain-containing protein [Candidatus Omnitrophota bacterium]MBU0895352.1 VWA domain-containing protein [Candidatus Omnitrophota bacterium]MBU1038471.1 VWA domain-containing protein [Candidatus Omnitrophota bacterium]MBU1809132.1 VWA domain-containing protein [Candidatus Omnitrophota bacterium]
MFAFKEPRALILLALVALVVLLSRIRRTDSTFLFSSKDLLEGIKPTFRLRFSKYLILFRAAVLALFILALARPQTILENSKTISEGVDIVLALDTSTSMLAEDFRMGQTRVNRFDVVKDVVKEFIKKRKDDRIALVAFAARAYTVCPLTTDYSWLNENLDRVRVGMIEDATAIGSAIATSVNRLRTSKTKSRVIIVLTDGVSNAGSISPLVAAEAAKALKIKVYAICVGSKGLVPYPLKDAYGRTVYKNVPIEMDEVMLKKIADLTGAKYYLASDTETLRKIYDDISKLEKSNIEQYGYREYEELFYLFLIPGLIILALEIFLTNTVFMRIP